MPPRTNEATRAARANLRIFGELVFIIVTSAWGRPCLGRMVVLLAVELFARDAVLLSNERYVQVKLFNQGASGKTRGRLKGNFSHEGLQRAEKGEGLVSVEETEPRRSGKRLVILCSSDSESPHFRANVPFSPFSPFAVLRARPSPLQSMSGQ